jgi:hypothetical protein
MSFEVTEFSPDKLELRWPRTNHDDHLCLMCVIGPGFEDLSIWWGYSCVDCPKNWMLV